MQFTYRRSYLQRFDRFSIDKQALIDQTNEQIRTYYATRQAPFGLRIKLLYSKGPGKIFEARVSQSIRIVWGEEGNTVSFELVGLHDEVKRYLRTRR